MNFNDANALVVDANEKRDTISYWLRDTTLVNQDTLRMEVQYMMTDSTGVLVSQTDTLEVLSKTSYEKRLKDREKAFEQWKKELEPLQKDYRKYQIKLLKLQISEYRKKLPAAEKKLRKLLEKED